MSVQTDGTVVHGLKLEAVLQSDECISLDHLARVLLDIRVDSSDIVDSLLSAYQRAFLDIVFWGDPKSRDKFNVILADKIDPVMDANQYTCRPEFENEIKQILADTYGSYFLDDGELLIMGARGIILVGERIKRHHKLLVSYLALEARDLFTQAFFRRTIALHGSLNQFE
eukprot:TRINITY_DN1543_c0_g1_i3.p1 TRINITY_DN1543_c0_g1~~TRINITY_DN1543_c0_g1_i3.p1  ORF type:complete len:170 (+),score=35.64 TRINITY_DN1543_c0_g1_i3:525-1034(+)